MEPVFENNFPQAAFMIDNYFVYIYISPSAFNFSEICGQMINI